MFFLIVLVSIFLLIVRIETTFTDNTSDYYLEADHPAIQDNATGIYHLKRKDQGTITSLTELIIKEYSSNTTIDSSTFVKEHTMDSNKNFEFCSISLTPNTIITITFNQTFNGRVFVIDRIEVNGNGYSALGMTMGIFANSELKYYPEYAMVNDEYNTITLTFQYYALPTTPVKILNTGEYGLGRNDAEKIRYSTYDVSELSFTSTNPIALYYKNVYYTHTNGLTLLTYKIDSKCKTVTESFTIEISCFANTIRTGKLELANKKYLITTNATGKVIFIADNLEVGSFPIYYILNSNNKNYKLTLGSDVKVINNYTMTYIEPYEIYEPFLTFHFMYKTDNPSRVAFFLHQNDVTVRTTECVEQGEFELKYHFGSDFKKNLKEGEATIYEKYFTCSGYQTSDTYLAVYLKYPKIDMVNFDIQIQSPNVVGENTITIATESLYDLTTVTKIKIRKRTYLDDIIEIEYTKDSEEYKIEYDEVTDTLTIYVTYLIGDFIELVEMSDDKNDTKTFNSLQYIIGYYNPIVVICPSMLALATYECKFSIAKWATYFDITSITQIDITSPSGVTKTYCVNDSSCTNQITTSTDNEYILSLELSEEGYYTIDNIITTDSSIVIDHFPQFKRYDDLTLLTQALQMATATSFISELEYPLDSFLLVNDHQALCESQSVPTIRKCDIKLDSYDSQSITDFKLLRDNIYFIIDTSIDLIIYEQAKTCQNSNDDNDMYITITSINSLDDYLLYLNGNYIDSIVSKENNVYEYHFNNDILHNGEYTSMTLMKDSNNKYEIVDHHIFYYVDNSIVSITTTIKDGERDQEIIFEFLIDVTYISKVILRDVNEDVDNRIVEPSECIKNGNQLKCIYDMSNYFGYEFEAIYYTTCRDKEYISGHIIQPIVQSSIIKPNKDVYELNETIQIKIIPNVHDEITYISFINTNDNTDIITFDNPSLINSKLLELALNTVGSFSIETMIDNNIITYNSTIIIIEHKIKFLNNMLILPKENNVIQGISIKLEDSIVREQIDYIQYEDIKLVDMLINIDDKAINIMFPMKVIYDTFDEHYLIIKDKAQENELIYIIKIVEPPTFSIPQTLFIAESPIKNVSVSIEETNGIIVNDIYEEIDYDYVKYSDYLYIVNTTETKDVDLVYKVHLFYYPIYTTIHILKDTISEIFPMSTLSQCNLVYSTSFSIDLTTTTIDENDISVMFTNDNPFSKDSTTNVYRTSSIEYKEYSMSLYYQMDGLPFYIKEFNVTSFDQSRNVFNITNDDFIIDFRDMICDVGITKLYINTIELSCEYAPYSLSCKLSDINEKDKLISGDFPIYTTDNDIFFNVKLIKCIKPNDRIVSSTGECLSSCKEHPTLKLEYNKECVAECPYNTGDINGYCIDGIEMTSIDDNTIKVNTPLEELAKIYLDNIEEFASYGKTIVGDNFSLQIYTTDSPIQNSNTSSLDFSSCEDAIRNKVSSLSSNEPLYIIKIDQDSNDIVKDVSYKVYSGTDNEISSSVYEGEIVSISYPINEDILDLSNGEAMAEKGVDVFNATDPFFSDLCYPYSTDNGTDMILKDRRKDIYQNVSFCDSNCVYKGINYTTRMVECDCTVTLNESFVMEDDSKSFGVNDVFQSNIGIVKCFSTFGKIKADNIGFISCTVVLLNVLICTIVFFTQDFIQLKSLINSTLFSPPSFDDVEAMIQYHTKVVGNPNELDNLPFQRAIKQDNRNIFQIFWKLLTDKADILKICFLGSPYETYCINLSFFVFSLTINFALNALFYTDDQLSSRYQQGELTFWQDMLRSLPANIIETIIGSIFKSFISYPPIFEMMVVEVKTKKFIKLLQKYYHSLFFKLIFYFIYQFTIMIFVLYYLTLFCIIYSSSQVSWFTGCLYSFLMSIVTNIGICTGLAILRLIGIKYNLKYAYNIELYAKNIL